jgi:hypothetical protein
MIFLVTNLCKIWRVTNIIYDLAVVAFDYAQGCCCLRLRSGLVLPSTTLRQQKPTQVTKANSGKKSPLRQQTSGQITKVISGFVRWLSEAYSGFIWWLSDTCSVFIRWLSGACFVFTWWLSEACFVFTWWLSEVETTIIDFYNSAVHPAMHRMPGSKS